MIPTDEPDNAGLIQMLKALGQGRGDLPRTVQMLIDAGGTNVILEMSPNKDEAVRNGLVMCFFHHRDLTADDKDAHRSTVIGDQYYPLIDVYGRNCPEEPGGDTSHHGYRQLRPHQR